jgi:hypothetical protein
MAMKNGLKMKIKKPSTLSTLNLMRNYHSNLGQVSWYIFGKIQTQTVYGK